MGTLGEYFNDLKEIYKAEKEERRQKYDLESIGAILKSQDVYELDGWFLYPSKGFAMNKKNNRIRMSLDKFIEQRIKK